MNLLDKKHRPKLAALALGGTLFIIVFISVYFQDEEIDIDEQTQCPTDNKYIQDYALVLLDGTDKIVGEYVQELHKKVRIIALGLPQYGKLSLHDVATGKKRLFMMCAPKSPDTYNVLTENITKLKNTYEEKYLSKIDKAVQTFLEKTSQTDTYISPILNSIADVTALSDFGAAEGQNFYIFSDMLEHYGKYTHHRDLSLGEFEWFRKQNLYQAIKPKLEGVKVHVYYLLRDTNKQFQSANHQSFWDDYFRDAGAENVEWSSINLPSEKSSFPSLETLPPPVPRKIPQVMSPPPAPKKTPPATSLPPMAIIPQSTLKPLSRSKSEQSNKCDLTMVSKYRNSITQSNGEDIQALHCLAKLCAKGQIVGKESNSVIDKMIEKAYIGDNIPLKFRESIGELYLHGLCGFRRSPADAYVLLSCVGEKNTARIRELQDWLYDEHF